MSFNLTGVSSPKKDMVLQNLIRPWSGTEEDVPVSEFLQDIEKAAISGNWTDTDKQLVCKLKLIGAAASCISGPPELQLAEATFQDYKKIFEEVITPEQHLLALNSVSQERGEGVREFADRCKIMGERTLTHKGSIEVQAWERKQMRRIILAAYVKGLIGEPGRQLLYNPPNNMEDAVRRAAMIEQAEGRTSLISARASGIYGVSHRSNERLTNGECFRCGRKLDILDWDNYS